MSGKARRTSQAQPLAGAAGLLSRLPVLRLSHVGMGQNETARGPQVLVFGFIYQGSLLGTYF